MDDLNLDENHFVSEHNWNNGILQIPPKAQGMTNNVGLIFNVGDTMLRFTMSIEQDT